MKQNLDNRIINEDGVVKLNDASIFDTLFINPKAINFVCADNSFEIETYNKWAKIYDLPKIEQEKTIDHSNLQNSWQMPEDYKNLDIEKYIIDLCKTDEELERCALELGMFYERNLYNLLRYMVYLVDTMRKNNIVWGVGRGSSVSSYVLYLIGIHSINSLKYKLQIEEFLK